MKQYIISERSYEYNDENYYSTEGGIPIKIITDPTKLNSILTELKSNFVKNSSECFSGKWIAGNNNDSIIEKFGKNNFESDCYGSYIKYDPDFSNLSDQLCLEFLELIDETPFIVTELDAD
jgi:hypothetical protein